MHPLRWLRRKTKRRRPSSFSLGDRGAPGIPGAREDIVDGKHISKPPYAPKELRSQRHGSRLARPRTHPQPAAEDIPSLQHTRFGGMSEKTRELLGSGLDRSLSANLKTIMRVFHAPRNSELSIRRLSLEHENRSLDSAIVYYPELVNAAAVEQAILGPSLRAKFAAKRIEDILFQLQNEVISAHDLEVGGDFASIAGAVVDGKTVMLLDGCEKALLINTRQVQHRTVEESPTEAVVRGPHTGFIENYGVNIGLLKGHLRTPDLVVERFYVGARSSQVHALVYIEGIVNPKIVEEARRRIANVSADWVGGSTLLNKFIEDAPQSPIPTTMLTERPDRVAAALAEGHAAIVGGSPTAIVFPSTVWKFMHTSEDYYIHRIPANLIRSVRWVALFLTVYASPLYVAVATFHHEMIPSELAFSIASAREGVPMPAAAEAFMLEFGFELIREGGIRIPSIIGPTIGIVGAVILGQAAVQARVVSAILVVIVAAAGLGAFAVPNYDLGMVARIAKFLMLAVAAFLGLPGIVFLSMAFLAYILGMRSFGVAFTAPVVPWTTHSKDIVFREPYSQMRHRPGSLRPLDRIRRPPKSAVTTEPAAKRKR